jgi:hypothetical protein
MAKPDTNHRRDHHSVRGERTMLAEDKKETVEKRIDWSRLVLSSIRDCHDEDTLIFGIQKVVEGLNEILPSTIPTFRRKRKN